MSSGTALKQVILKTIPHEFIKGVDLSKLGFDDPKEVPGVELVQKLIDKATDDMRMYGSAPQLFNDLNVYQQFTSSHRYFEMDMTEEYQIEPMIYHNMDGFAIICKQDLYPKIQKFLFSKFQNDQLSREVIMIYFKTSEEKLRNCCEFIRFDKEEIKKFFRIISEVAKWFKVDKSVKCNADSTFDDLFDEWKQLMPDDWTDVQYEPIRRSLQKYLDKNPIGKNWNKYLLAFSKCKCQLRLLRNFIEFHPEWFEPDRPLNDNIVHLRVLLVDNQHVVLKSELFNVINGCNPERKPKNYKDENGILRTLTLDEACRHFGEQIESADTFMAAILKTKYGEIPTMTPFGDYCISGGQAVRFIWNHLISVIKIFRRIGKDSRSLVDEFWKIHRKALTWDTKSPHFLTMDKVNSIIEHASDHFKDYMNTPVKSIRNVRKVGFHPDYLKKELRDLGLFDAFPNIESIVVPIYNVLIKLKKGKHLNTSDLFEAVDLCQLNCLYQVFKREVQGYRTFSGTFWDQYKSEDVKIQTIKSKTAPETCRMVCSDGSCLYSNVLYWSEFMKGDNTWKPFVMDHCDIMFTFDNTSERNDSDVSLELQDIHSFIKFRPGKHIYVRTINDSEVFTEEVLDIIPIVLEQQKASIDDDLLKKYQNDWTGMTTISLSLFQRVCEELDINMNNITIVPDPQQELARSENETTHDLPVDTSEKAVVEVVWKSENVENIPKVDDLEETFSIDSEDDNNNEFEHLSEVNYQLRKEKMSILEERLGQESKMNATLQELVNTYEKRIGYEEREIEKIRHVNSILTTTLKDYDALKVKLSKYQDDEVKLKEANRKLTESKNQLTNRVTNLESQLKTEKQKTQKTIQEIEKEKCDLNRKLIDIQSTCKEGMARMDGLIKESAAKHMKLEANWKRVIDSTSQNVAQLESKLVKKNSEMGKLTEKYEEMKNLRQLDDMKNRNLEGLTASLKRTILNHEVTENGLRTRNQQLEAQLESEKQKTKELASGAIQQLQTLKNQMSSLVETSLEKENSEIKAVNNRLQEANGRLTERVEEQARTIKSFFDRLGPSQSSYSNSSTQTTSLTTSQLRSFQKIRDSFQSGNQLKQAKEMVEKLISIRPELREMTRYELQQYEGLIEHYLQSIHLNMTSPQALPDYPTFSDRFLNEYWKSVDYKPTPAEAPEDSECLICLIEMTADEKTMKCESCRKVLHLECASQWLKRHRSCPHCRRELLDPNEFPPLA